MATQPENYFQAGSCAFPMWPKAAETSGIQAYAASKAQKVIHTQAFSYGEKNDRT